MKKKVFHLHIRKTSGTVLFRGLLNEYGKDSVLPYRSDLEIFGKFPDQESREREVSKVSVISGHFYKFAQEVPQDYVRVTILRNPVERTISAFNHMKSDRLDPKHVEIADLSFADAMNDARFAHELWNGQTRALVAASGENFEKLDDAGRVNTALHTLKKMELVGFQENLEPFYKKLRTNLQIQIDYDERVNHKITSKGARLADVINCSGALALKNRLDIVVYFESLKIGCL